MRPLFATAALAATLLASAPAFADHYEFDKQHTNILFFISHMGYSTMVGRFTSFDGSFDFDENKPENSKVDVTLDPAGIRTSSSALDEHLQGEQWFNAAKYPHIHFVSSSVKVTGDHDADVTGDATLLGVTKPVVLHVHLNKVGYNTMTKLYEAGFDATATLKRSDFGMSAYVPLVGDEVKIQISTEATDMDRKKAEEIKH